MAVIDHVDVHFNDDGTLMDTAVLFKDNGWVRVGTDGVYTYYPPREIERIEHIQTDGEADS